MTEGREKRVRVKIARRRTYTSGEIADMIDSSCRTVVKCMDKGDLVHYRLPHSRDRRVRHEDLIMWMNRHSLPIPPEIDTCTILLAGYVWPELTARLEGRGFKAVCGEDAFHCGVLAEKHKPAAAILNIPKLGRWTAKPMLDYLNRQECICIACSVFDDVSAEVLVKEGYAQAFPCEEVPENIVEAVKVLIESRKDK